MSDKYYFDSLCQILNSAKGKNNAITLDRLTQLASLPNRRTTEMIINQYLSDFPFVVVSGSTGLYIPDNADDINKYLHSLHSRHKQMQSREKTIRKKARAHGWPEEAGHFVNPSKSNQLELFV